MSDGGHQTPRPVRPRVYCHAFGTVKIAHVTGRIAPHKWQFCSRCGKRVRIAW